MLLHPNNAGMQTDAVAALGNMCLRMPLNCEAIAEAGGLPAIVTAFQQHVGHARMQSKGPLAVRNLVGRNPELIPQLKELGAKTREFGATLKRQKIATKQLNKTAKDCI